MFSTIMLTCFLFLVAIFIKFKYFKSRREKLLLKVPGPAYNFIWGNAVDFNVDREDVFDKFMDLAKQFSGCQIVRLWFGNIPYILVHGANAAEEILSSNKMLSKGDYDLFKPWLGDGILMSTGQKWRSRRKLLTPAFHFGILEKFLLTMNEQAVILTKLLKTEQLNESFNIYPYLTRCTLDIICETAMGKTIHAQTFKNLDFIEAIKGLSEIATYRSYRPWLSYDFIFNLTAKGQQWKQHLTTAHNFTRRIIQERREEHLEEMKKSPAEEKLEFEDIYGKKRRVAFLDLLLQCQDDNRIDEEGIGEEVDTFMFAGHDTTSAGLAWFLYNIGRFPGVQDKIQEELDTVLGPEEVDSISSSQLKEMNYLECTLKESMRLFPPAPFYAREVTEETNLMGYVLPVGTIVMIAVKAIHTNPEHFPDPMTFNPDRFLPENSRNRHPYAYVPFSAGPRNCIGQKFALFEEKVLAAHILHRFKITSIDQDERGCKGYPEIILKPVNGPYLKLESRR